MKFLSFKILALCILLPPVLYVSSALFIEHRLQRQFIREIENKYIGDARPVLEGSVRLKEVVNRNISAYLKGQKLIPLGIRVTVTITTKTGRVLYPADFETEENPPLVPNPSEVAAENFALMNEGIDLKVDTRFEHNRLLSNGILALCLFISVLILYLHFRTVSGKAKIEEQERAFEISRLRELETENTRQLKALQQERKSLQSEFEGLKEIMADEKKKAERNEDDLIEEIESLEARLEENLARQDDQQQEIVELEGKIRQFEQGRLKVVKHKTRESDSVKKRFNTLYKNLSINNRAVGGYLDLNEELKLKAEEIIHQLNDNPDLVTIKRKVFGGKGHKTVLEVVFGYKGRLYFRNTGDKQIEVLAIGTKNTQARELEFLSKL